MKKVALISSLLTASSLSVFAQVAQSSSAGGLGVTTSGQAVLNLFSIILGIVSGVGPYAVGAVLLGVVYFTGQYLLARRNEHRKEVCKVLIGKLFVLLCGIVAVWGVVGLLAQILQTK